MDSRPYPASLLDTHGDSLAVKGLHGLLDGLIMLRTDAEGRKVKLRNCGRIVQTAGSRPVDTYLSPTA